MSMFYKISDDGTAQIGFAQHDDGFKVYTAGEEPDELLVAMEVTRSKADEHIVHKNALRLIAEAKQLKEKNVADIVVTTTTGKVFDGDEKSQDRMLRAISIAALTGETETEWKLYDNTIVIVTLDELKEAIIKAGKNMSNIWLNKTKQQGE